MKDKHSPLKPCPFCGGVAVLETYPVRKGWEAEARCNGGCLASQRSITWDEEDEAAESAVFAWNNRSPAFDALVDALEGMLECSSCKNKCPEGDMTCATNKAKAALQIARGAR